MNFIMTHNEGIIEVHIHSPNCRKIKGDNVWHYSFIGKISGDTWEEVVKNSAYGCEAIGKYIYIVPDKCMINSFPDAVKTKYKFKEVD